MTVTWSPRRGETGAMRQRDTGGMQGQWPLVGREIELRQLRDVLTGDAPRGVVLAGPAGVGKSRLAGECLRLAEQAGQVTARATATRAAARLPFGALAPLLPAAPQSETGAVDDRADLLRRFAGALLEQTSGRRLILFIDDAHLLDDASATLIHQLADANSASVLATVRTGEPSPDPVVALWKDGLTERMELGGLRSEAIEDLLSSVLGARTDPAAAALLAVRCQGNVLFLRELVLGALRDGTLRDDGGIWRLVAPLSPSDRLVELVEARLGELDRAERALLEVVSFAESVGLAELNALGDPILAEELERKELLQSRRDGRRLEVRLAHPIYGDVLRARLPALRATTIARSLADVVEAAGARRREDTLRVATWRLDGGGARPELMLDAATMARWHYDFPLAERLAGAALAAGAGFDAALLAAQLAGLQGRGAQAEAELAVLASHATDNRQRGLVAISRVENAFNLGHIEEGLRIAQDAEAGIADPAWRDEVTARRSAMILGTQGPRAAAEATAPLLGRAEGRALAWACQVASYCLGRLGRIDEALEASRRGFAAHLAVTLPMDWYPWTHLFLRCDALAHGGRLAEAEALAVDQYDEALAERSAEAQAFFAWQLGKLVGARGRVRTAARHGREAVALFRQLDRPQMMQFSLVYLVLAQALAGHAHEARQTLATLDELGLQPTIYMGIDLLQAQAWTEVAAGDLPQGRRLLEQAVIEGKRIGDLVGASAALHDLARLGHAKEVQAELCDLAATIEGVLASARAKHAAALARGDPQVLAEVSSDFDDMGADLLAAEAAADAAVAWACRGDAREAAGCKRRSANLANRCEGAETPSLQAIESRVRLTRAEREAAMLAAAGRSNKEIAGELFLSVRTVANRLQRVYEKLGVSGRTELASALEEGTPR